MKTEITSGLLAKVLAGVATAATLAGGTAIVKSAETNAVQDQRLETVEKTVESIGTLSEDLNTTSREVALLRKELEMERKR